MRVNETANIIQKNEKIENNATYKIYEELS